MTWDTNKEAVTLTNAMSYTESETDPYSASLAVYLMALNHLGFKYFDKGDEQRANLLFNMEDAIKNEMFDRAEVSNDNKEENETDISAVVSFLD